MTPAQVIATARTLLNDDSTLLAHRYSDAQLLSLVNKAVQTVATLRPDLVIFSGDITVTSGEAEQTLPSTAIRLVQINRVKNGAALAEADKTVLDQSYPEWYTDTPGTPTNFMRHPRTPTRYYLNPPPDATVTLVGEYTKAPSTYALSDTIELNDVYMSPLVDGVVYLAESVDTETIGTGRAAYFQNSFLQGFGIDLSQRALVDNDNGLVNAKIATAAAPTPQDQGQGQ